MITKVLVSIAIAVIIAEFYIVFRARADRRAWENIKEASNE